MKLERRFFGLHGSAADDEFTMFNQTITRVSGKYNNRVVSTSLVTMRRCHWQMLPKCGDFFIDHEAKNVQTISRRRE